MQRQAGCRQKWGSLPIILEVCHDRQTSKNFFNHNRLLKYQFRGQLYFVLDYWVVTNGLCKQAFPSESALLSTPSIANDDLAPRSNKEFRRHAKVAISGSLLKLSQQLHHHSMEHDFRRNFKFPGN